MFLQDFLFRRAPVPGKLFDQFGNNSLTCAYLGWWKATEETLTQWHFKRLGELSPEFRFEQSMQDLMNARVEARAKGINPRDPAYPRLADFQRRSN